MDETLGGAVIFFYLFLFVLMILWFLLPFAIFGTKDRLNQIISESKRTNEQLARLREQLSDAIASQTLSESIRPFRATDD